ncbi:class I SAM-dependent methyltransferase [Sphingomonas sp. ID0503]|uniref:class I SAM-dependent methyltransferase n=1 Tax=Sphingomonas sp. ID0503 TaxID=3399691 RepID=UPI003AFAC3F0
MWMLDAFLKRIVVNGRLIAIDPDGRVHEYGRAADGFPELTIRLTDSAVQRAIISNPQLGAGEGFMDGRLIVEQGDIRDLIDIILHNLRWENAGLLQDSALRRALGSVKGKLDRINWQAKSKRNVAHHYDLSDRLYDLFLDADRQYSCAYYTDPANSLEQAQRDKKAHIAAKLNLRPGNRVLDIGCGWGGMALYINEVSGAEVLGVTLSEEQLKVARRRAEEKGVADKVKFELIDYRNVTGTFDRIVSVGMFEHVGPAHYETFFAKCRSLLAEDGAMLLHTIGRIGTPGVTDAWTAKYIFPGGYSPSLSEIVTASERAHLIVSDVETLRLHYALTLDEWYARTNAAKAEIVALYDERFFRMWQFYLAGAAAAFKFGDHVNFQLQYIRDRYALPMTRDYMTATEHDLTPFS